MALLGRVQRMTLSPCRNILLMLQELHRLGFERLRAHCYIYATGTWRCEIIPASWLTDQNRMTHDASPYGLRERLQSLLGLNNIIGFYSSANGQRAFQTEGAVFLSPRDLAKQYLQEYPVIAGAGYGPDPEYAAWYDGMLDTLAPNGVFYAYAEYTEPADHLYAHMARVNTVPLPPPVKLDASEWQRFLTRFEPD